MNKKKGMKSYRTSSWLKVDVKISPCLESTTYNRLAIFLCQKPTACNIDHGDGRCVSWRQNHNYFTKVALFIITNLNFILVKIYIVTSYVNFM